MFSVKWVSQHLPIILCACSAPRSPSTDCCAWLAAFKHLLVLQKHFCKMSAGPVLTWKQYSNICTYHLGFVLYCIYKQMCLFWILKKNGWTAYTVYSPAPLHFLSHFLFTVYYWSHFVSCDCFKWTWVYSVFLQQVTLHDYLFINFYQLRLIFRIGNL